MPAWKSDPSRSGAVTSRSSPWMSCTPRASSSAMRDEEVCRVSRLAAAGRSRRDAAPSSAMRKTCATRGQACRLRPGCGTGAARRSARRATSTSGPGTGRSRSAAPSSAAAYWRTPANTEAKYLLLRHAFESLGCVPRGAQTDGRNTALAGRHRAPGRGARGRAPEAHERARLPARHGVFLPILERVAGGEGPPRGEARASASVDRRRDQVEASAACVGAPSGQSSGAGSDPLHRRRGPAFGSTGRNRRAARTAGPRGPGGPGARWPSPGASGRADPSWRTRRIGRRADRRRGSRRGAR